MSLNEVRQLDWIHDLYRLGQSDLLQKNTDEVFERILQHIVKGFNANTGSLALYQGDDHNQLSIVAGIGLPPECIGSVIDPGSGIIGWVVENGKPLLLKGDVADDPRFNIKTRKKQTSVPSSSLCWPLQLDNRTIGALSVNSLNGVSYNEADLESGRVPVNLITMVIDNARLHHEKEQQNKALEEKVEQRTKQIRNAMQHLDRANENLKKQYIDSIRAFSRIIEMRPGIKSGQSKYIAEKSLLVARKLDMSTEDKKNILYAGFLIQIGKMSLPDKLLAVPFYKIPPLEKQNYLKHAVEGEALLKGLTQLQGASVLIRHQYERYDGSGFPDHLAKQDIPMGSRILNVVGDYIAYLEGSMTGEVMPVSAAINLLMSRKESFYDPEIVDAFIEVLEENIEEDEEAEAEKKSWRNSRLLTGGERSAAFDRPVIEISWTQLTAGMEIESVYFGNKPYIRNSCMADARIIQNIAALRENTGTDPTIKILLGAK